MEINIQWSGAILEIGLRVGVVPLNSNLKTFSVQISQFILTQESKSFFKELYFPYYVQNFK